MFALRFLTSLAFMGWLSACGAPEPVATGYKKKIAAPGAVTGTTPGVSPNGSGNVAGGAANLVNGQTLYGQLCASCHQPLATTAKPNKTVAQLDANAPAKNASHASVGTKWPTGQAAIDLAAALKK